MRRSWPVLVVALVVAGGARGASDTAAGWGAAAVVAPPAGSGGVRLPVVARDAHGGATAVWEVSTADGYLGATARRASGGRWSAPEGLPGGVAAQLAVDPRGDALVVWTAVSGISQRIRAVFRPAGGHWRAPVDLSPAGETGSVPQVKLDARGNALVVWPAYSGTSSAIRSITRSAAGRWSRVQTLAGNGSGDVDLAMNARGQALIAWVESGSVRVSTRSAAGRWSPPSILSPPRDTALDPKVALNDAGAAVVIWHGTPTGSLPVVLEGAIRPAGGRFGRARRIGGEVSGATRVSIGGSGEAVAIWSNRDALFASARRPGGGFGRPQALGASGFGPAVGVDGGGNALAVWTRSDGTTLYLHAARRPARGVFGRGVDLASVGADCFLHRCPVGGEASIAVDAHGDATAVWIVLPNPRQYTGGYVEAASYLAR